jgi:hypothetical protein
MLNLLIHEHGISLFFVLLDIHLSKYVIMVGKLETMLYFNFLFPCVHSNQPHYWAVVKSLTLFQASFEPIPGKKRGIKTHDLHLPFSDTIPVRMLDASL